MHSPLSGARVALALCAALLGACDAGGGAGRSRQARGRCPSQPDSLVSAAVLAYVKDVVPLTPHRFLIAAGTDSALPDAAMTALQQKGPTYLFPRDSAQQVKFRQQLGAKGDFPTLLIAYRGLRQPDAEHATVRFGARYVGGAREGKAVAAHALQFQCDTAARWRLVRSDAEQSS